MSRSWSAVVMSERSRTVTAIHSRQVSGASRGCGRVGDVMWASVGWSSGEELEELAGGHDAAEADVVVDAGDLASDGVGRVDGGGLGVERSASDVGSSLVGGAPFVDVAAQVADAVGAGGSFVGAHGRGCSGTGAGDVGDQ